MTDPQTGEVPGWLDLVDGRVLPKPIAGHPGLELCNTFAGWDDPDQESHDYLREHADACAWAVHVGVLDPRLGRAARRAGAVDPAGAEHVLVQLRELRTAVRDVLTKARPGAARKVVAGQVQVATQSLTLGFEGKDARLVFSAQPGARLPLVGAAWAAAGLLTDDVRHRIRICPGAGCGWMFIDTSGRRRWCQMASCGNRAKVRRHASGRQRH